MRLCMMPGCQTTAGCQCEQNRRALSGVAGAPLGTDELTELRAENKTLKMALHVIMRRGTPTREELAQIEAALHK